MATQISQEAKQLVLDWVAPEFTHVVEFGVGKGKFIREMALQFPEKRFLGVELVQTWIDFAQYRLDKHMVSNVLLVNGLSQDVIQLLPEQSIAEFYILFPDPWPKRRHASRRVVQTEFLSLIHHRLRPGGRLLLVTDHAEYFSWMTQKVKPFLENAFKQIENNVSCFSNYHVKYQKEGRPIYSLHLQKI